jgi:hypothetical protein
LTKEKEHNVPKQKRPLWKRMLRVFLKFLAVLLMLFITLVLVVRSEWGQNLIVNKVVNYVSNKTNTKVEIEKLFITFDGDIQLNGLYLEDKKGDTLVYSKSLEAGIPLWEAINGDIGIDNVDWEGLRANIIRKDSINGFNYEFLVNAFTPKDTTTTATDKDAQLPNISIGTVNFKDFNLKFIDEVSGINSKVKLGEFNLDMNEFDLNQMRFEIDDVALKNTKVTFLQTKSVPETEDVNETPKPYISIGKLSLEDVEGTFESVPNKLFADANIGELILKLDEADLLKNTVNVPQFSLNSSTLLFKMEDTPEDADKVSKPIKSQPFEWPIWTVNVDEIEMQDNNISYFINNAVSNRGVFNPDAIVINEFNFKAEDLQLKDKTIQASIAQLQFNEASGIQLKETNLNLTVTDTEASVTDLKVKVNNNYLRGRLKFDYNSLASAIDAPENATLNLDIPNFLVNVNDVFLFQPDLRQNEYLRTLSTKELTGTLKMYGLLSDVNIPNARIDWGNTTNITVKGRIQNATDVDNLQLNIPSYTINSTKTDLSQFVIEDSLGVSIPKNIKIKGNLRGKLDDITTDSRIATTDGDVIIKGSFKNTKTIAFDAFIETDSLRLGKILKNDQLSTLNLTLKANGSGSTVNTLNANVKANIRDFKYANYIYDTIALQGELKDGQGPINLDYKDENLNMKLKSIVTLDSVSPNIDATLDIIGADLQALGITKRNIKTAFQFNVNFEGNAETFDARTTIHDAVSVYDNQTYLIGELTANTFVRPDTTYLKVDNRMLNLELESNANPTQTTTAITEHINSYLSKQELPDSLRFVKLKLKSKITDAPVLKDVFLADLRQLDTVNIDVDFSAEKRNLVAKVEAPFINYADNELDSLAFNLNSSRDSLTFNFGLKSLKAGPIDIKRTEVLGEVSNDSLKLDFLAFNNTEKLIHIKPEFFRQGDSLSLHINPSDLTLNAKPWSIPSNNRLKYIDNVLDIDDFTLSREGQSVTISNKKPNVAKDHLGIDFKGFKLSSILSYLNPDEVLAKGELNGEVVLEEPFGQSGLLADLSIQRFRVMDVDLSTLTLKANSSGGDTYNLNMLVNGGAVDLQLKGDYLAKATGAELDLNLDINEFKMEALEGFSQEQIKNASGSFKGNIAVSGTTTVPQYKGDLNFNDAKFNVAQLNAGFQLGNETLRLDNAGLYFNNFKIADENNNTFVVDGDVLTESFINPAFNLSFKAKDFRVLNSTKEDNDLYYGTAIFDLDATLSGDLELPRLDATLNIGSETNVTYVLPPSQVAVESRDGVVIFVNKDNPDSILTQTKEEESAIISGFDIKTTIKVGKEAVVNVIIEEQTGDNLRIQGDADLKFNIYPNGRTTLTGRYTVNDGHYELSLYNLVKRRFELRKGSTITWAGDPLDATLDASAIYRVKTSASALMASTTSGADISTKQRFRQELPFLVYLNVDGQLDEPKLTFDINLPEDEQGAIGGQVYGRLQQLNQQENELNKQVFSLLVLNRFFPDTGSDGSGGGTASIARDNINQALSDQLNVYADKLLGNTGVELDFGLDSYTDYQGNSPTERTTLDVAAQKKFLDDRLVVRVGSEVDVQGSSSTQGDGSTTPLVGNVSIEYLLTENGKYRLKGFRRNQFDNVIDGQLIVSGLAIIFTQEFNKFDELFRNFLSSRTGADAKKKDDTEVKEKKENN